MTADYDPSGVTVLFRGAYLRVANDMAGVRRYGIDIYARDTLYMHEIGETRFSARRKSRNLDQKSSG